MIASGNFGRGGHRHVHVILTFQGTLTPGFVKFLEDKAERLSLPLFIEQRGDRVVAETQGQDGLIGAFEMSAMIGPECSKVESYDTRVL